jgi:hypothetical protein
MKRDGRQQRGARFFQRKPRRLARSVERLESRDLLSADPWQNPLNRYDVVGGDGQVTPADALAIINALNNGITALPAVTSGSTMTPQSLGYLDVDGTGVVTPQDALAVIDVLNTGFEMTNSLVAVNASGDPITTIPVGSTFYLESLVQDSRATTDVTGVEAAYSDVTYQSSMATIPAGAKITYGSNFPSTQLGNLATAGVIDQIGAVATTAPASPLASELLWSLPVTATATGTLNFINGPDTIDNSTLFPGAAVVPTTQISYVGASIQVVSTALPTLSVNSVSVAEPISGNTSTATFTVSLSAPSTSAVSVDYATVNGTAVAGTDYVSNNSATNGAISFPPGTTTQYVPVTILNNPNFVVGENFSLDLNSPSSNATLQNAQGTGTIVQGAVQLPAVSIQGTTLAEAGAGNQSATFTVNLSSAASQNVTIDYSTADGTAIAGTDYTGVTNGTLTISKGSTTGTIPVPIDQTVTTGSKTFFVNLTTSANYTIVGGQASATLFPPGSATNSGDLAAISVKLTNFAGPSGNTVTSLTPGDTFTAEVDVQDDRTYAVTSVAVDSGGSGYTSAPTVAFINGGGAGATATATISAGGVVTSITVTNGGSGYTSAPTVVLSGGLGTGGTAATANAGLANTLAYVGSVAVTNGGSGYTSAPTVAFSGGGGTSAAATATISAGGVVTSITVTNGGSGYTSTPTVVLSGGLSTGGTAAAATAALPLNSGVYFAYTDLNWTAGVAAMTPTPGEPNNINATFSGDYGSDLAYGNLSSTSSTDAVPFVVVTSGGTGYASAPTVTLSGGGGSGAMATATIGAGGVVTSITVTSGGSGYTSAPTVGFSGGGGSGAAATAELADNLLSGIGATANTDQTPLGPGELELFTIPMTVIGTGSLAFTPFPANVNGGDAGLFGDNNAVPDTQIDYIGSATVPIGSSGSVSTSVPNDFSITPSVTVQNVTLGTTTATFTVTRSSPDNTAITIPVSTADGTAVAGADYLPLVDYPLNFGPNQTTATVQVTVIGNPLNDASKMFTVTLGTPVQTGTKTDDGSLVAGKSTGTVTINSAATEPIITVSTATAPEGDQLQFLVNLVGANGQPLQSDQPVTVHFATADGTALAGTDYDSVSGTLNFPAGVTQEIVTVNTLYDAANTTGRTFQLNLSNATNATFSGPAGTTSISALGTITFVQRTSISGYVYVDTSDSGIFEPSDTGIAGVTVTLTDTTTGVTTTIGGSGGTVTSAAVTSGGSGYTSAPTVTISGGGGMGATAIATISAGEVVTSITITGGGTGYTSAPTVTLTGGGGSGAVATAATGITTLTSAGTVTTVAITSGGTGYASAPTVTISGGGGSGATATATINASGVVTSITIIDQGGGYTSAPMVTLTGGGGSGAAATAQLSGLGYYIFSGLTPGDTYSVTKTNPGFFVDGNKVTSVATPAPTGKITPDEYTGIVIAANTVAQNYNFPELGLRAEFISVFINRRAFLSSSIITHEYGPGTVETASQTFNLQNGTVWISFDGGWQGLETITANYNPAQGSVTMSLYDTNLNLLASSSSGQISYDSTLVSLGSPYFLEITGTNPDVTLQVANPSSSASSMSISPTVTSAAVSASVSTPPAATAGNTGTAPSQNTVAMIAAAQATPAKTVAETVLEQEIDWLKSLFA